MNPSKVYRSHYTYLSFHWMAVENSIQGIINAHYRHLIKDMQYHLARSERDPKI